MTGEASPLTPRIPSSTPGMKAALVTRDFDYAAFLNRAVEVCKSGFCILIGKWRSNVRNSIRGQFVVR